MRESVFLAVSKQRAVSYYVTDDDRKGARGERVYRTEFERGTRNRMRARSGTTIVTSNVFELTSVLTSEGQSFEASRLIR